MLCQHGNKQSISCYGISSRSVWLVLKTIPSQQLIPINGVDLGIVLPINAFLSSHLKVLVRHRKSRLTRQFRLHHGHKLFVVSNEQQLKVAMR